MAQLALHKYHGLRNDFLIVLNDAGLDISTSLVQHMCDRIEGVGADGFISVERPHSEDASFSVRWWNADGSPFQMSGNGVRCAAHCLVDRGVANEGAVEIETPAGLRVVEVGSSNGPGRRETSVNMGAAAVSQPNGQVAEFVGDLATSVAFVDVGNPHLVIRDDAEFINLYQWGARAQESIEDGINLELAALKSESLIDMRVWERGVGPTQACGTGATAVAAAFHDWNVVKDEVVVHQPGGDAILRKVANEWFLSSPTVYVSSVNVDVVN